jgi:predicted unusual protein kinase regulating ubiquinone biosynthesis (AarF/ABC1/UbiB family)
MAHVGTRSEKPGLRRQVAERLIQGRSELPIHGLGRLGRTALAAARGGGLFLGKRAIDGLRSAREQGEIDPETLARLVSSVGQLKGVAMKVGQIMSYIDVALPEELRVALSALQTHAQPMPFEEVEEILSEELGDAAAELVEGMDRRPVAAASIGQVHRSQLADGRPVAVKVQYRGIDRAIANEFGAASAGVILPRLLFPAAHIEAFVDEARERILEECDYEHEMRLQQRFRELFDGHPIVRVPAVHVRWCSRRVLTSTWADGLQFQDYLASEPPQEQRDRMGTALFEFYVGSLFRHHLYNCDPHPGNYLPRRDGTLVLLDFGCTREFDPEFVLRLEALTRAVHSDRRDALHQAFVDLGMVREGQAYDFGTARDLVRSFHGPMLRDETQAIDLGAGLQMRRILERKMELLKLRLPGEFLFLFRIRFGLMSVLAQLGARANWYRLERACMEHAAAP